MYFRMNVVFGTIEEIEEEDVSGQSIAIEASSEEDFWNAVEKIEGDCAKDTPFDKIEMGVEREFLLADPIKFKGMPVEVVRKLSENHFDLKIKVSENIFIYVSVKNGYCFLLEPLE